jgi:hypothetical protein
LKSQHLLQVSIYFISLFYLPDYSPNTSSTNEAKIQPRTGTESNKTCEGLRARFCIINRSQPMKHAFEFAEENINAMKKLGV